MSDGYTLRAFCDAFNLNGVAARELLLGVGFKFVPVEIHYTDEEPRVSSVRHFQRISPEFAEAAIRRMRARQGDRLLRRRKRK